MKKTSELPDIDLNELEKFKEKNFKERLEFIDWYSDWVKRTPNKRWTKYQNDIIVNR